MLVGADGGLGGGGWGCWFEERRVEVGGMYLLLEGLTTFTAVALAIA